MCQKEFSFWHFFEGESMRNIKLTIEYDGKDFGRVAKTT